jgi:hypothetical protein
VCACVGFSEAVSFLLFHFHDSCDSGIHLQYVPHPLTSLTFKCSHEGAQQ